MNRKDIGILIIMGVIILGGINNYLYFTEKIGPLLSCIVSVILWTIAYTGYRLYKDNRYTEISLEIRLDDKWIKHLEGLPDSGQDFKICDFYFGESIITHIIVLSNAYPKGFELLDQDLSQITDIKLTKL